MNFPSSTPLLTFNIAGGGNFSAEILASIRNIVSENLEDDSPKTALANREAWCSFLVAVTDSFLVSFPRYNDVVWNDMPDKLRLVDITLEAITLSAKRVESLHTGPDHFTKRLFVRLLNFYNILESWSDAQSETGELPTPQFLKSKAFDAIVTTLRCLGSHVPSADRADHATWKLLRMILTECLEVGQELLSLAIPPLFPITLTLFNAPRIQETRSNDLDNPLSLTLDNASDIPTLLISVIDIVVGAVHPPLLCHWFLADVIRNIRETASTLFASIFSGCSLSPPKRAKYLTQVVVSMSRFPLLSSNLHDIFGDMAFQLLRHRLDEGPLPEWEPLDPILATAFSTASLRISQQKSNVSMVLDTIRSEKWGPEGKNLRVVMSSYLRACLMHLDADILATMRDTLTSLMLSDEYAHVLDQIAQRLQSFSPVVAPIPLGKLQDRWRLQVKEHTQMILSPDSIDWIDDDGGFTDQQFILRSLNDIQTRFTRPRQAALTSDRISIVDTLAKLACQVARREHPECTPGARSLRAPMISSFIPAFASLFAGHEVDVTCKFKRRAFDAMRHIIKHEESNPGNDQLKQASVLIMHGVQDKDRDVRLGAGRALVQLILVISDSGIHSLKLTEFIVTQFYNIMDTAKDPIKESSIVIMGQIGKAVETDVLGQVISFLIAQLGQHNPVLKGAAYMQLLAMTRHYGKSPYSLIFPYMHQVAPYLVSRLCSEPSLLAEACHFLMVAPGDFLSITSARSLPYVFANCEYKVLEEISKQTSRKASALFLNHSFKILAHIFLLPDRDHSNSALTFVVEVLTAAADNAAIDLPSVIRSCLVPLVTELVIVFGDGDAENAKLARQALEKVESSLFVPTRAMRVLPPHNLGDFLKTHTLGVITNMTERLQEIQGKQPTEMKRQILRSLGFLVTQIGPSVSSVAPQIMATLQTMIRHPELSDVVLETWYSFLKTLNPGDVGAHIGPTSASYISSWSSFSLSARNTAKQCMDYIIFKLGRQLGKQLDDVVDLADIPELAEAHEKIQQLRQGWTPTEKLQRVLERTSSDNITVAHQSLTEFKSALLEHKELISDLASGDIFDPLVGQILEALTAAACRDGEDIESFHLLAFECIGILGAVDPDRCEIAYNDPRMVVLSNFEDEGESVAFALHLIKDLLVGAFRSASDIKHQSHLAFSIQELLRLCKFTPSLLAVTPGSTSAVPLKVRSRWNTLPKVVLETVTPLLEARLTLDEKPLPAMEHPIYLHQPTYREWIQLWTIYLISKASGQVARNIFGVFRSAVRNKDVGVAHHLLPHLVLNILISGDEEDAQKIRMELLAVLEDQVNAESTSTADKKLLSAQAVFMLMDHLNKWVRVIRQEISSKKLDNKRARPNQISDPAEEQLLRVDSILSSIDQNLMARAALHCKAYARALMNFERQVVSLRERSASASEYPTYYERLHEIYAHLDEPDGMEGISTLILSPSLEHQIRQHESTGRWTSAQSCWEVRLQHSPDNLDFHLGLLRCLRNLGHYDTLRTHVRGVLIRNPDWESALAGFQVESAWMVGAWADVQSLVEHTKAQSPQVFMAKVLLAMRTGDIATIDTSLFQARSMLGAPITASGARGYRRSYDAVLDLHIIHELEIIRAALKSLSAGPAANSQSRRREVLAQLSRTLSTRLDATLPTFRTREPILSMRRTAFTLLDLRHPLTEEIGRSWLASAKIARKAGQWQTAYSAMLQAQQNKAAFSFIESAKLVKTTGEPLRALQELENSMRLVGFIDVLDLTEDDEMKRMKAKAQALRARWMNESERFETSQILTTFKTATDLWPKWESGNYHLGQYHDECYKDLSAADRKTRGIRMNHYTVRFFARAIRHGSKYVYQTVPRLLTIWLDMGEDRAAAGGEVFKKVNDLVAKAIKEIPAYKWFTAFPQIVSRVGHSNPDVYKHLAKLIVLVMQEYPKQALWLFTSVVKSTKQQREQRGRQILDQLRSNPGNAGKQVPALIAQCLAMTNELLALCDYHIADDSKKTLTMTKDFPKLAALGHSPLIIPLQESLTASLPPTSSSDATHQPFPLDAPTFDQFFDEIDVMRSLAKPRKITIRGSNGQVYMFLGKPKDDLRKDARLMDFNAIINKLLKANSESRRRQLRIRTYGVVTLNEECGFIQWVPNTIPIRPILVKGYEARRIRSWSGEMNDVFKKIKDLPDKEAGQLFISKILPIFPPVFHDWFIETFPEPSAWLASRLSYGRTAAVMSMVGFILGLGDRHCENILLDINTGDVVHVDFNCLFEKGKSLETPERVPFRLTQNLIDGMGVTGVEGVFRIACEVTMQLLRDNKDSLMSVLDAFIHDPLVEWEDEKRKLEREPSRRNQVKASVDLHMLAKNALNPIEKKLKGIYSTSKEKQEGKEVSTSNLVQMLIQEATNPANLGKMYPGWASWH